MNPTGSAATVEKAVDLLFHLHTERAPRGPTSIARGLGLPKSSVHRLLAALARRGLVERDGRGRYRSGLGLVALGLGALESEPVVAAARSPLEEEAELVGETFFLVATRAGELRVLHKAEGTGFLRAAPRVGSRVPAHATAVGKIYLAFAPELLAPAPEGRTRFTPRTLVASADLETSVEQARRRGWAQNRDEWIPGLSVLASPIRCDGRLIAAVALAAATPRLETLMEQGAAARVCRLAERVGQRLAGRLP